MSKLGLKVFLIILAIAMGGLMLVSVVLNYSVDRQFKNYLNLEQREKIERLVRILAASYQEKDTISNWPLIIRDFLQMNNINLVIVGPRGQEIILPGPGMGMGGTMRGRWFDNLRNKDFNLKIADSLPVKINDRILARVYWQKVIKPEVISAQGQYFIKKTNQAIFFSSILVAIITVIISFWLSRYVTDPLTRMSYIAGKVSEGDFNHKLKIKGNDEIAELSHAFNEMVVRLKH
ncbi:MAG: HAMP domain-containing protein, partial [Halanaerobiales bacterium]